MKLEIPKAKEEHQVAKIVEKKKKNKWLTFLFVIILTLGIATAIYFFSGGQMISNILSMGSDNVLGFRSNQDMKLEKPKSSNIIIQPTCEDAILKIVQTDKAYPVEIKGDNIMIKSDTPILSSKAVPIRIEVSKTNYTTDSKTEEIIKTEYKEVVYEKSITLTSLSATQEIKEAELTTKELLCLYGGVLHIGENSTLVSLDYTKDLADIYGYIGFPTPQQAFSLIKWDITSLPAGATIDDGTLCLYITNQPSGPIDTDVRVWYWANQSWTESTLKAGINASTLQRTNQTDAVLSSVSNSAYTCFNVTTQLKHSYGIGDKNFTVRFEDVDYLVSTNLWAVGDDYLVIGNIGGGESAYFEDRENNGGTNYRPYLNITYTAGTSPVYPEIRFVSPTPADATTTKNASVFINVSINESNLKTASFGWGTNYTIYNIADTKAIWSFDNNSAIGENSTLVVGFRGNNNLTITGATLVDGKFGKAYSFDGNDFMNSTQAGLNVGNFYTIMFWTKLSTTTQTNWAGILGKGTTSNDYYIQFDNSQKLIVYHGGARIASSITTTQMGTTWKHIAITYDTDANQTKFYMDGVLKTTVSTTANPTGTGDLLKIGVERSGVYYFKGALDDIRIYNRTFTQTEISKVQMASISKTTPNTYNIYVNQTYSAGTLNYISCAENTDDLKNCTEQRSLVFLETNAPTLTIISPNQSQGFYTGSSVPFEISADEELSSAWMTLNNGVTNYTMTLNGSSTGANYTNTSIADGTYNVIFYANDTTNNIGLTGARTFSLTSPVCYPNNHFNGTWEDAINENDEFICIAENDFDTIEYWTNRGYGDGVLRLNQTKTDYVNASIGFFSYANSPDGMFTWGICANTTSGVRKCFAENMTYHTDNTKPLISITSPTNGTTYNDFITDAYYSYTEVNPNTCSYSLNSETSQTITCGNAITSLDVLEGWNNLTINISDKAGNTNSSLVYFNISLSENSSIIPPTVNIVFPSFTSYNALTLDINATCYPADAEETADRIWYSVDGGVTNSSFEAAGYNWTGISFPTGTTNLRVSCNDSTSLVGYDDVTFDICIQTLVNTTKTDWSNVGSCLISDEQNQSRSWIQYDSHTCGTYTNVTFYEYQLIPCDYCVKTLANTTATEWQNETCVGENMNQSKTWIEYDTNGCYEITSLESDLWTNTTHIEEQSQAPIYANTTLTDWTSGICSGDNLNQSRNKTEYDIFGCGANTTWFEYNITSPYLVNITITDWTNIGCIGETGYHNETKNTTQYNTYQCGANTSIIEYRSVANVSCEAVDDTPPTFFNCRNLTGYTNTSLSWNMSAYDSSGIGTYVLNQTDNFSVSDIGMITNATHINIANFWNLNLSVNDTSNNLAECLFSINISDRIIAEGGTATTCLYKKFGYYNLKLPWFRQVGCV